MDMDEADGKMIVSSTNISEDSGYDNGFLSDSSTSSGNLFFSEACVFSGSCNKKKGTRTNHTCILTNYDISGNGIVTISPRTFQYLSNCVTVLNLSNNEINSLPETISQLKNLKELNLSHNRLHGVPESCKVLRKLKVLKLSNNCLVEIPECLEIGMDQLTHIDLSHNAIPSFLKPPMCLHVLRSLNLSHNWFQSLPLWLFSEQCRSLVELDMSFNYCFDDQYMYSQLPVLKHYRTSALKSLQCLNISNIGAKFDMIGSLCNFEALNCLHMGNVVRSRVNGQKSIENNNYFWKISLSIFSNPLSIVELHISNVEVAGLPEDFCKLENLKVLDVSHNPLDWLPESFGKLKSLQEVILTSCSLSYLPDSFNQLTSLKKLILDNNLLTDVRDALSDLNGLEWLDLYDNLLEEIPLTESHWQKLRKIDLEQNYLKLDQVLQDVKVNGESALDVYSRLQKSLREADDSFVNCRCIGSKTISTSSWCHSSESLHHHKSYFSESGSEYSYDTNKQDVNSQKEDEAIIESEEDNWDDDSKSISDYFDPNKSPHHHKSYFSESGSEYSYDTNKQDVNSQKEDEAIIESEEDNWDDDSKSISDYFDPNMVLRYALPPGRYPFGWTPPQVRQRRCQIPISLELSGFVYVPGDSHASSTRRHRVNIKKEPTYNGQFDDMDDLTSEERDTLLDFLKQTYILVRNPQGPCVIRCRICSIYEDCWHDGRWIAF